MTFEQWLDDNPELTNKERDVASAAWRAGVDANKHRLHFRFTMAGIEPGATLVSIIDNSITAEVIDDRNIRIHGQTEVMSLSLAAMKLVGPHKSRSGPRSWTYNGKTLDELRCEGD